MKFNYHNYMNTILLTVCFLVLSACGSSGSSSSTFKVGGTVTGLSSNGLILKNNGADDLEVAGITFEFATALANGAVYDVTVQDQPATQSCDISAGSGTVSGANVADVQVTCRNWRTAEFIENQAEYATEAQVAVDGNGNAIAVWLQTVTYGIVTEREVWVNQYTAGSGWGLAKPIAGILAREVQIDINNNGDAIVVWSEFNDIWANQYIVGSGWGTAVLLEVDEGSANNPQITIDEKGNALAVWQQNKVGGIDIYANRYTAGSGWGSPELIETDNTDKSSSNPQIAMNSSGEAAAVWLQNPSSVRTNRYIPGEGWGSAESIEKYTGSIGVPQVAINDAGNTVAVWRQSATRAMVWANYYKATTGWGTAVKIDLENGNDADEPHAGIDDKGNVVAVWRQDDALQFNIYSNRYTSGTGWGSPELIEDINVVGDTKAGIAVSPQIAVDANGNALTVWALDDNSPVSIYANRYTAGSGWGSAELIEKDDAGSAWMPQVAVSKNGNAVAVWHQFDGSVFNIKANRFE